MKSKFGFTMFELLMVIAIIVGICSSTTFAQETKYAAGLSSAAVTFAPQYLGKTVVKSLSATTDKEGGVVKYYARGGAGKILPSANATNGAVVIALANASYSLTNGDVVVYSRASGAFLKTTISDATTSTVTLASAITEAGTTGDAVYELTQQGQILVGMLGSGVGTNDVLNLSGDALFITPVDSPLYIVLDGTSNSVLQVTAQ